MTEKSELEKFSERERNLSTAEKTFRVFSRSGTFNRCYIRQPYEQTFRELQQLIEAGSFGLNMIYY